jgi:hypothetical protein
VVKHGLFIAKIEQNLAKNADFSKKSKIKNI